MIDAGYTDFGFKRVSPGHKASLVTDVFSSVASDYDLMNDLMSFGIHRLWKRYAVHISHVRRAARVLDVAGGTGDMSVLYRDKVGSEGSVIISDINASMLANARSRLFDKGLINGIDYVRADAECLPFASCSFDCVSIAFGLRNVTDKARALASMYDKLKYGGSIIILEFSNVVLPLLKKIYDNYSLKLIPKLGEIVVKDKDSYQYLVESIRMHPDQETLKAMVESAGFSNVSYFNLSAGIVAVHRGYKL